VRDETGRSCGTLKVTVKWRKPLRPGGRHLGPNALTATETELLISRFSKQKDGQVRLSCTYFNSSNIGATYIVHSVLLTPTMFCELNCYLFVR
jgi:hypothetical protein